MPARAAVSASARKNKPIATPDASAIPTPGGSAPARTVADAAVSCWLTSTMATIASAIPSAVIRVSRSPTSTPAATGIITAHTAVVGATTVILPTASARYNSATPVPPASPAVPPQIRSRTVGVANGNSGRMSSNSARPAPCEVTTMVMVFVCREARPPRKSAAPYSAAEPRASR